MDNEVWSETQAKIHNLSGEIETYREWLSSASHPYGDWKMIKYQEAILLGLEPPYTEEEMKAYHEKRQEYRNKINELKKEIEKLEKEGDK